MKRAYSFIKNIGGDFELGNSSTENEELDCQVGSLKENLLQAECSSGLFIRTERSLDRRKAPGRDRERVSGPGQVDRLINCRVGDLCWVICFAR